MRMTKMIAAVAAIAMTATPALAQSAANSNTNAASKLSIAKNVRASSKPGKSNALADGPSTITALVLGGLLVAGIVVAATGGDDTPDSN